MYVSCSSQGFNFHHLNLFQFIILTVLTLTCSILIANLRTTLKNISRALSTSGTSVSSCFLFNTFISSHPFPVPLLFTFSPLLSFSSSLSSPSYPFSFSVPPLRTSLTSPLFSLLLYSLTLTLTPLSISPPLLPPLIPNLTISCHSPLPSSTSYILPTHAPTSLSLRTICISFSLPNISFTWENAFTHPLVLKRGTRSMWGSGAKDLTHYPLIPHGVPMLRI